MRSGAERSGGRGEVGKEGGLESRKGREREVVEATGDGHVIMGLLGLGSLGFSLYWPVPSWLVWAGRWGNGSRRSTLLFSPFPRYCLFPLVRLSTDGGMSVARGFVNGPWHVDVGSIIRGSLGTLVVLFGDWEK